MAQFSKRCRYELNQCMIAHLTRSVEETEDLTTDLSLSGLVVGDDTLVGGEDDETELSGREDGVAELLEVLELEVESGRDNTALVESTVEVNNDLVATLVIDDGELTDVALLLHSLEELDDDLGDGSEHNLVRAWNGQLIMSIDEEYD